jgi:hypothetical protein
MLNNRRQSYNQKETYYVRMPACPGDTFFSQVLPESIEIGVLVN